MNKIQTDKSPNGERGVFTNPANLGQNLIKLAIESVWELKGTIPESDIIAITGRLQGFKEALE